MVTYDPSRGVFAEARNNKASRRALCRLLLLLRACVVAMPSGHMVAWRGAGVGAGGRLLSLGVMT